jgi:hypothetical protein
MVSEQIQSNQVFRKAIGSLNRVEDGENAVFQYTINELVKSGPS